MIVAVLVVVVVVAKAGVVILKWQNKDIWNILKNLGNDDEDDVSGSCDEWWKDCW